MFDFFKRKKNAPEAAKETPAESESPEQSAEQPPEQVQADSTETVTEAAAPAAEVVAAESTVTEDEAVEVPAAEKPADIVSAEAAPAQPKTQDKPLDNQGTKKPGFFSRIRQGLSKTRSGLSDGLANLLLGKKEIDDDLLEELETQLIMADVGVEATQDIMSRLTARVSRKELSDSDALYNALIGELQDTLGDVW